MSIKEIQVKKDSVLLITWISNKQHEANTKVALDIIRNLLESYPHYFLLQITIKKLVHNKSR